LGRISLLVATAAAGAVLAPVDPGQAQAPTTVSISLEAPEGEPTVRNGLPVFIGGWAADVAQGASVRSVDIYVDGPAGQGTWVGVANYGLVRSDVATVLGRPDLTNSGFGLEWIPDALSEGPHTLYLYARSTSGDMASATATVVGDGEVRASPSNPIFRRLPGLGWEIDTGGPTVRIERDPRDNPSRDRD
jgi:hypothetical protein